MKRAGVAVALRMLSRTVENLRAAERKVDDPYRTLLDVIERIEQRIKDAQEAFDVKWYELDYEDRLAAQATGRTNMEF